MQEKSEPKFAYHAVSDSGDICNYKRETKQLNEWMDSGKKIILYGRRNTGKTSIVKSIVIPSFRERHKSAFVLFADFMGCTTLEDLTSRIKSGFEQAFNEAFRVKSKFIGMIDVLKSLRPSFDVDPVTGSTSLNVQFHPKSNTEKSINALFDEIKLLSDHCQVLLAFDEFQDIHMVPKAEAILRNYLQHLPSSIPVIALGSKKHLLSQIFIKPNAPFAQWGTPLELPPIEVSEYQKYMNDRFKRKSLKIDYKNAKHLMELVQFVPESINMLCDTIQQMDLKGEIGKNHIELGVNLTVERFSTYYRELMIRFSQSEIAVLSRLAHLQPVKQMRAVGFLQTLAVSSAAVGKIFKRFEDEGTIYRTNDGYVVSDPIFGLFMQKNYKSL